MQGIVGRPAQRAESGQKALIGGPGVVRRPFRRAGISHEALKVVRK